MKRLALLGMGIVLLTIISFGCGGGKTAKVDDIGLTNTPTTVKSADDLPKMVTTPKEIAKEGVIRVIAESAKGQSQYDALTAARGVAQKKLLDIISGVKVNAATLIAKGELKEEDIKLITEGHIKAFDCGAFYDRSSQTGYYCMEVPLGGKK